jgi:MYXO-CTERM domain-containing protein
MSLLTLFALVGLTQAQEYTSRADFLSAAGGEITELTFSDQSAGTIITTQYAGTAGVTFGGSSVMVLSTTAFSDRFGLFCDCKAGVTLTFSSPQTALGVEHPGGMLISLLDASGTILSTTALEGGSGTGYFLGVISATAFSSAVLQDTGDNTLAIDTLLLVTPSDRDGDGVADGADCEPDDANIYPGAPDEPYDGVDSNCDEGEEYDLDGDGHDGIDGGGDDCDDQNAAVYPGAVELDDGLDNDCDGRDETYDGDGDGLSDLDELPLGTDPNKADSDGDGLDDGEEVNSLGTDPLLQDSDGGGVPDGEEVSAGADPLDPEDDRPEEEPDDSDPPTDDTGDGGDGGGGDKKGGCATAPTSAPTSTLGALSALIFAFATRRRRR